ncbi:hypothetical protein [Pseudomonas sp. KUIN-1]|uniref:hypothetical protein n=1 Tax=Pseudomonas sp. KUIN-1 TaxID=2609418 RepID=UPI001261174F|nr:hypothetical protein [Pseudomonas sp. KUIN-1]BBN60917.1 hypothetical protein KUIN1_01070 [Pseudomonas sp. KUIN-1]
MNDKCVVIDLSANEAGVLEDSAEQLQHEAYQKLRDGIEKQIYSLGTFSYRDIRDTDITYPRVHNAILIEGSRGSGKTTFLLKSLEKLKRDEELQLSVLRLIDPTLIETKENIVVVILSAIETALAQVQGDTRALDDAREGLAEGLGLLDGIGASSVYGSEWEDAKWVMSQGLRKASKGRDFEKKLGIYIEHALDMLKKKAFVLTFDDVDTNFSHGYIILETVRKYLTHPRLAIILSGDIELYGRLLRKNIYLAFGKQLLERDPILMGLSNQRVGDAVLELEEQYLLKIAPPQNRISMVPLGGLKQYSEGKIEIILVSGTLKSATKVEVRRWANESISELMHEIPNVSIHPFFNIVAMEPLRLVIGYMRALDAKNERRYSAIFTAFSTRLHAQGIPADLISKGDLDSSLRIVLEWMSKQKDAPDLVRFGVSSDVSRAIVVHCLALSLAQKLRGHVGNALKALLGLALPLAMMRRPVLLDTGVRNSLFRFLWSQSTVTASELAARLGAVDRSNERANKLRGSSFGSVGLANRVDSKSMLHTWYCVSEGKPHVKNVIDSKALSEHSKRWLKSFGSNAQDLQVRNGTGWLFIDDLIEVRCGRFGEVLRLPVSKRFNERGEVMRSISALSLLGVIADLLTADYIEELDAFGQFDVILPFEDIEKASITSDNDTDDDDDLDEYGDEPDPKNQNSYEIFKSSMRDWHVYARGLELKMSPALLGRIALRLHDDLLSLDEKVTTKWRSGEILHRQIICILHGILATSSSVQGRKETSKTSDQAFVDLLRRFSDEDMPVLAAVLLSCPLIWIFLDPVGLGCKHKLFDVAGKALKRMGVNGYIPHPYLTGLKNETIEVLIGPTRGNSYNIEIVSFYELLNVVPRYAAK